MNNFVNQFGKFFWLYYLFGIVLILGGLSWIFFLVSDSIQSNTSKGKGSKKNKEDIKEEVSDDNDMFL